MPSSASMSSTGGEPAAGAAAIDPTQLIAASGSAPPGVPDAPKAVPASPAPGAAPTAAPAAARKGAWSPLAIPLFRALWVATVVSYVGTWAREAGGQELMALLASGRADQANLIARVVSLSNLPICLLSVFAGVLADVLDRKRFLVVTQLWMVGVSLVLAVLTLAGAITPFSLLLTMLLLGVGTALSGPAFQAIVPELVPPSEMPLAVALNSVALNVARAVGPMLFGLFVWAVVARAGEPWHRPAVGLAFLVTAISFTGVAYVLWRWDRPPQRAAVHGEGMWVAMLAGVRYTVHSRAMRAILVRVVAFIVCAVVVWAQFKLIATGQLGVTGTIGFSALMSFMGLGAIVGVVLMPKLQRRYSIDKVVNGSTVLFAVGLVAIAFVTNVWVAYGLMFFLGINWVVVPTNFNVATQKSVPAWVKGRAISMYLTVLFGSFSVGSEVWGRFTRLTSADPTKPNPHWSLLAAGVAMAAGLLLLARRYPLTINDGQDLSPAYPKGTTPPPLAAGTLPEAGHVRATVNYVIAPSREAEFRAVMHHLGEQRRRNGADRWELVQVVPTAGAAAAGVGSVLAFRERFAYPTVAEFNRQAGRLTKADLKLQEQARSFHVGSEPAVPTVNANRIGWRGERLCE